MIPAAKSATTRPFSRADEVVKLYRAILVEARKFWDDRTRAFIVYRARKRFRDHANDDDIELLGKSLRKARQYLHGLEKANDNDHKAIMRELEYAYGRRGTIRHWLLQPFLSYDPLKRPGPLIPTRPSSRPPPILSGPLSALLRLHHKKALEPTLPVPQYKPLAPSREVNIRHRHRMRLLDTVGAPLPEVLWRELEIRVAGDEAFDVNEPKKGWQLYEREGKDGRIVYPEALRHLIVPAEDLIPISRVRRVAKQLDERQRRRCFAELLRGIPILSPCPTSLAMVLDDGVKYGVRISDFAKGVLPAVTERDWEGLEEEYEAGDDGKEGGKRGKQRSVR